MWVPAQPPISEPQRVAELQSWLLDACEIAIGPRQHAHTILPATFNDSGPGFAERRGGIIRIDLQPLAANDWQVCVAQLGHELVHAVNGLTGWPTWLEEGVATAFGIGQCFAMFNEVPGYLCRGRYGEAVHDVGRIPSLFVVVRRLRAHGVSLSGVTPALLKAASAGIDAALADKLCRRFN